MTTWQRLDHVELSGTATTINSSTFSAYENLRVKVYTINTGGYVNAKLQFNSITGSEYASIYSDNGGSKQNSASQSSYDLRMGELESPAYSETYISNISDKEKFFHTNTICQNTAGAGNLPNYSQVAGKFAKTDQSITSIQVIKSASGSFASGSYMTIYGANPAPVTVDVITVDGFTAKKNLMIKIKTIASGAIKENITFNNDTGNNYARRRSNNGDTDSTDNTQPQLEVYGDDTKDRFLNLNVINEASKEKLVIGENIQNPTGTGTAPTRTEWVGKWANTSNAITRVDVTNTGSGSYDEGSEVIVWGDDGTADTTYPNLQGGFIIEETDTGKHYIWNSTTSTWTEIS